MELEVVGLGEVEVARLEVVGPQEVGPDFHADAGFLVAAGGFLTAFLAAADGFLASPDRVLAVGFWAVAGSFAFVAAPDWSLATCDSFARAPTAATSRNPLKPTFPHFSASASMLF